MNILVCNVGSTSLKFKLYDMPDEQPRFSGRMERIGDAGRGIYTRTNHVKGCTQRFEGQSILCYRDGILRFLDDMTGEGGALRDVGQLHAVGFKTVMSEGFGGVAELTDEVMEGMRAYLRMAPVHNRAYIDAIEQFKALLPGVTMIGAFENAFHHSIPMEHRVYGLPYAWYEAYGIERKGYHGNSHGYIASRVTELAGERYRLISCHLGGSSSICAIRDGRSIANTFGFSVQTGLPHTARAGDFDAYILPYLMGKGMTMEEVLEGIETNGGLRGISGLGGDMRDIEQAARDGNERAALAYDYFVAEIVKGIGGFTALLGGLDYVVFTAGIGENSSSLRASVCEKLKYLGLMLDEERNREGRGVISAMDSAIAVLVLPTDEETGIARACLKNLGRA